METIRTSRQIIDSLTGATVVEKGVPGEVLDYRVQPGNPSQVLPLDEFAQRHLIFNATFDVVGPRKLVYPVDFSFDDGTMALMRILMKGAIIDDIKLTFGLDAVNPAQFPTAFKLRLSNGINVTVLADRVTGTVKVQFDANQSFEPIS